jgi:FKBP-type peptidyl-prolyl cis-trans isomerase
MAAIPEESLRPGVAQSSLMTKYGQAIDRDSAREMLARKLEEGSAAAEREKQAAEAAKQAEQQAKDDEKARAQAERESHAPAARAKQEKSVFEQVANSGVFKDFARTAGREIVRSIFGTARRK